MTDSTTVTAPTAAIMAELATPAGRSDPYPLYERLRALGDCLTGPDDSLIITGYRKCSALLREPRFARTRGVCSRCRAFPIGVSVRRCS
ncbi:MAG: hypothetical protein ABI323_11855 [Solirubrobacteraceae bacterium]